MLNFIRNSSATKLLWSNLIFAGVSIGVTACSSGSNTATSPSPAVQSCKFSQKSFMINADTYRPGDKFATVFENCEFERAFEDKFNTAYADTPTQSSTIRDFYSYANLQAAFNRMFPVRSTPNRPFNSGDYFTDMRELSAFLANISQETNSGSPAGFDSSGKLNNSSAVGVVYGLSWAAEGSCASSGLCTSYGTKKSYCDPNMPADDPREAYSKTCNAYSADTEYCKLAQEFCAGVNSSSALDYDDTNTNNQYFGRGAKQLSYASGYITYGSYMYPDDKLKIARNPNLLSTDGEVAWSSGLAFWSYPTLPTSNASKGKPSMHEGFLQKTTYFGSSSANKDFDELVGFGKTIDLINGAVECGKQMTYVPYQVLNRVNSYIELLFLTNYKIPIDKLVVTRSVSGQEVQDIYTHDDLLNNISRQGATGINFTFGPDSPLIDATSPYAPHLVKKYHRVENGVLVEKTYNIKELTNSLPEYMYKWGTNGRYNTQPLISDYYYPSKTVTLTTAAGTQIVKTSDIKNITLYYDVNSSYNIQQLASERLDCSGVTNADGN
jgi:hypothetical protein